DPVGVFDRDDGAKYWIQLYAQAGRPTGGYMTLRTGYKTISFKYYRCKRHHWHFHCGWRTKTIRIPYPKMTWIKTMAWNQSDWIAFSGGKGWYGSYDPGESRPNQFIRIPAHHGDFDYMLWNMEHGKNHKTNNKFNININRGYKTPFDEFRKVETKYGAKVADYGNTFWK
ncbi:MAG: hypothetical protein HRU25_15770, partial [Psychrobium sp.]|nr:hypothetical protein [Psychrobium sp.]